MTRVIHPCGECGIDQGDHGRADHRWTPKTVSDIATEQREAWALMCCGTTTDVHTFNCVAPAVKVWRCTICSHPFPTESSRDSHEALLCKRRHTISGTPATMLGEALGHIDRATALITEVIKRGVGTSHLVSIHDDGDVLAELHTAMVAVKLAKGEADAKEGR